MSLPRQPGSVARAETSSPRCSRWPMRPRSHAASRYPGQRGLHERGRPRCRGLPLIATLADTATFIPTRPGHVLLRITKQLGRW